MGKITVLRNGRESRHLAFRTSDRLTERYDDYVLNVKRKAREYSARFDDKVRRIRERSSKSKIETLARASVRKIRNAGRSDVIIPLSSVEDMRNATRRMQNLIMSHERTREAWSRGRVAGYELDHNVDPYQRHAKRHSLSLHRMLNDKRPQRENGEAVVHMYANANCGEQTLTEHDKAIGRLVHVRLDDLWNGAEDFTSQGNNLL